MGGYRQAREEGFDDAFRELFDPARRAAERILGDRTEAEDVAAEALARALVRWSKVRDLSYREAWVVRVAINLAIDVARKQRRPLPELGPIDDPADAAALRLTLTAALASLPRRQREVVALRYLGDYSEAQVADALGIAASSVKHAFAAPGVYKVSVDLSSALFCDPRYDSEQTREQASAIVTVTVTAP